MKKKLEWSVNTPELLGEIIPNVMEKESISPSIIRIFASLLGEVAKRATELHDAKLDSLMLRLNLYELDGRNSKERNENRVRLIDQLEKEYEKQKNHEQEKDKRL